MCLTFRIDYAEIEIIDLDYEEDSNVTMDANFVLTHDGKIIEIQCTAEEHPVEEEQFNDLMKLARDGIKTLCELQLKAIG